MMTVNLYCDWPDHLNHLQMIEQSFAAVAWLPEVHDGNMVAIAFKQSPSVDFDDLYARAKEIHATLGLPAETWVDGLHSWMSQDRSEERRVGKEGVIKSRSRWVPYHSKKK